MKMINTYDDVLKSIEAIVKNTTNKMGFDKTVVGKITQRLSPAGTYKVQIDNKIFDAISSFINLEVDEYVYVTIPNGNYSETKIITGRKEIKKEEEVGIKPRDQIISFNEVDFGEQLDDINYTDFGEEKELSKIWFKSSYYEKIQALSKVKLYNLKIKLNNNYTDEKENSYKHSTLLEDEYRDSEACIFDCDENIKIKFNELDENFYIFIYKKIGETYYFYNDEDSYPNNYQIFKDFDITTLNNFNLNDKEIKLQKNNNYICIINFPRTTTNLNYNFVESIIQLNDKGEDILEEKDSLFFNAKGYKKNSDEKYYLLDIDRGNYSFIENNQVSVDSNGIINNNYYIFNSDMQNQNGKVFNKNNIYYYNYEGYIKYIGDFIEGKSYYLYNSSQSYELSIIENSEQFEANKDQLFEFFNGYIKIPLLDLNDGDTMPDGYYYKNGSLFISTKNTNFNSTKTYYFAKNNESFIPLINNNGIIEEAESTKCYLKEDNYCLEKDSKYIENYPIDLINQRYEKVYFSCDLIPQITNQNFIEEFTDIISGEYKIIIDFIDWKNQVLQREELSHTLITGEIFNSITPLKLEKCFFIDNELIEDNFKKVKYIKISFKAENINNFYDRNLNEGNTKPQIIINNFNFILGLDPVNFVEEDIVDIYPVLAFNKKTLKGTLNGKETDDLKNILCINNEEYIKYYQTDGYSYIKQNKNIDIGWDILEFNKDLKKIERIDYLSSNLDENIDFDWYEYSLGAAPTKICLNESKEPLLKEYNWEESEFDSFVENKFEVIPKLQYGEYYNINYEYYEKKSFKYIKKDNDDLVLSLNNDYYIPINQKGKNYNLKLDYYIYNESKKEYEKINFNSGYIQLEGNKIINDCYIFILASKKSSYEKDKEYCEKNDNKFLQKEQNDMKLKLQKNYYIIESSLENQNDHEYDPSKDYYQLNGENYEYIDPSTWMIIPEGETIPRPIEDKDIINQECYIIESSLKNQNGREYNPEKIYYEEESIYEKIDNETVLKNLIIDNEIIEYENRNGYIYNKNTIYYKKENENYIEIEESDIDNLKDLGGGVKVINQDFYEQINKTERYNQMEEISTSDYVEFNQDSFYVENENNYILSDLLSLEIQNDDSTIYSINTDKVLKLNKNYFFKNQKNKVYDSSNNYYQKNERKYEYIDPLTWMIIPEGETEGKLIETGNIINQDCYLLNLSENQNNYKYDLFKDYYQKNGENYEKINPLTQEIDIINQNCYTILNLSRDQNNHEYDPSKDYYQVNRENYKYIDIPILTGDNKINQDCYLLNSDFKNQNSYEYDSSKDYYQKNGENYEYIDPSTWMIIPEGETIPRPIEDKDTIKQECYIIESSSENQNGYEYISSNNYYQKNGGIYEYINPSFQKIIPEGETEEKLMINQECYLLDFSDNQNDHEYDPSKNYYQEIKGIYIYKHIDKKVLSFQKTDVIKQDCYIIDSNFENQNGHEYDSSKDYYKINIENYKYINTSTWTPGNVINQDCYILNNVYVKKNNNLYQNVSSKIEKDIYFSNDYYIIDTEGEQIAKKYNLINTYYYKKNYDYEKINTPILTGDNKINQDCYLLNLSGDQNGYEYDPSKDYYQANEGGYEYINPLIQKIILEGESEEKLIIDQDCFVISLSENQNGQEYISSNDYYKVVKILNFLDEKDIKIKFEGNYYKNVSINDEQYDSNNIYCQKVNNNYEKIELKDLLLKVNKNYYIFEKSNNSKNIYKKDIINNQYVLNNNGNGYMLIINYKNENSKIKEISDQYYLFHIFHLLSQVKESKIQLKVEKNNKILSSNIIIFTNNSQDVLIQENDEDIYLYLNDNSNGIYNIYNLDKTAIENLNYIINENNEKNKIERFITLTDISKDLDWFFINFMGEKIKINNDIDLFSNINTNIEKFYFKEENGKLNKNKLFFTLKDSLQNNNVEYIGCNFNNTEKQNKNLFMLKQKFNNELFYRSFMMFDMKGKESSASYRKCISFNFDMPLTIKLKENSGFQFLLYENFNENQKKYYFENNKQEIFENFLGTEIYPWISDKEGEEVKLNCEKSIDYTICLKKELFKNQNGYKYDSSNKYYQKNGENYKYIDIPILTGDNKISQECYIINSGFENQNDHEYDPSNRYYQKNGENYEYIDTPALTSDNKINQECYVYFYNFENFIPKNLFILESKYDHKYYPIKCDFFNTNGSPYNFSLILDQSYNPRTFLGFKLEEKNFYKKLNKSKNYDNALNYFIFLNQNGHKYDSFNDYYEIKGENYEYIEPLTWMITEITPDGEISRPIKDNDIINQDCYTPKSAFTYKQIFYETSIINEGKKYYYINKSEKSNIFNWKEYNKSEDLDISNYKLGELFYQKIDKINLEELEYDFKNSYIKIIDIDQNEEIYDSSNKYYKKFYNYEKIDTSIWTPGNAISLECYLLNFSKNQNDHEYDPSNDYYKINIKNYEYIGIPVLTSDNKINQDCYLLNFSENQNDHEYDPSKDYYQVNGEGYEYINPSIQKKIPEGETEEKLIINQDCYIRNPGLKNQNGYEYDPFKSYYKINIKNYEYIDPSTWMIIPEGETEEKLIETGDIINQDCYIIESSSENQNGHEYNSSKDYYSKLKLYKYIDPLTWMIIPEGETTSKKIENGNKIDQECYIGYNSEKWYYKTTEIKNDSISIIPQIFNLDGKNISNNIQDKITWSFNEINSQFQKIIKIKDSDNNNFTDYTSFAPLSLELNIDFMKSNNITLSKLIKILQKLGNTLILNAEIFYNGYQLKTSIPIGFSTNYQLLMTGPINLNYNTENVMSFHYYEIPYIFHDLQSFNTKFNFLNFNYSEISLNKLYAEKNSFKEEQIFEKVNFLNNTEDLEPLDIYLLGNKNSINLTTQYKKINYNKIETLKINKNENSVFINNLESYKKYLVKIPLSVEKFYIKSIEDILENFEEDDILKYEIYKYLLSENNELYIDIKKEIFKNLYEKNEIKKIIDNKLNEILINLYYNSQYSNCSIEQSNDSNDIILKEIEAEDEGKIYFDDNYSIKENYIFSKIKIKDDKGNKEEILYQSLYWFIKNILIENIEYFTNHDNIKLKLSKISEGKGYINYIIKNILPKIQYFDLKKYLINTDSLLNKNIDEKIFQIFLKQLGIETYALKLNNNKDFIIKIILDIIKQQDIYIYIQNKNNFQISKNLLNLQINSIFDFNFNENKNIIIYEINEESIIYNGENLINYNDIYCIDNTLELKKLSLIQIVQLSQLKNFNNFFQNNLKLFKIQLNKTIDLMDNNKKYFYKKDNSGILNNLLNGKYLKENINYNNQNISFSLLNKDLDFLFDLKQFVEGKALIRISNTFNLEYFFDDNIYLITIDAKDFFNFTVESDINIYYVENSNWVDIKKLGSKGTIPCRNGFTYKICFSEYPTILKFYINNQLIEDILKNLFFSSLNIKMNKYPTSLINSWDNNTTVKEGKDGYITTTQLISGLKTDTKNNLYSGTLIGVPLINDIYSDLNTNNGIYGFSNGEINYKLTEDEEFVLGKDIENRLIFDGKTGKINNGAYIEKTSGTLLDLSVGLIDSYNFSLKSKNLLLNSGDNKTNFLTIINNDNNNLMTIGDNAYYMQSANYNDQIKSGSQLDLNNGNFISKNGFITLEDNVVNYILSNHFKAYYHLGFFKGKNIYDELTNDTIQVPEKNDNYFDTNNNFNEDISKNDNFTEICLMDFAIEEVDPSKIKRDKDDCIVDDYYIMGIDPAVNIDPSKNQKNKPYNSKMLYYKEFYNYEYIDIPVLTSDNKINQDCYLLNLSGDQNGYEYISSKDYYQKNGKNYEKIDTLALTSDNKINQECYIILNLSENQNGYEYIYSNDYYFKLKLYKYIDPSTWMIIPEGETIPRPIEDGDIIDQDCYKAQANNEKNKKYKSGSRYYKIGILFDYKVYVNNENFFNKTESEPGPESTAEIQLNDNYGYLFSLKNGGGDGTQYTDIFTWANDLQIQTEKQCFEFLYNYIFNDIAIVCGILANILVESCCDPFVEYYYNGMTNYGLCQWRDRYFNLQTFCGVEKPTSEQQLKFLKHELETTENRTYQELFELNSNFKDSTAKKAEQAAYIWASTYERCERSSYERRTGLAIYVFNYYNENWSKIVKTEV